MVGRSLMPFAELQFDLSDRLIKSGEVVKGGSFGTE
jgi:hypothetical protein